jgi:uncharacterized protein YbaR (Trm112 family)
VDERVLALLACPSCHGALSYAGERRDGRLSSGALECVDCGAGFLVEDEVPRLDLPGVDLDGTLARRPAVEVAGWVRRNFDNARRRTGLPPLFEAEIASVRGLVVDVASGPGGSFCVPLMADEGADRLLLMTDLAPYVMVAWRRLLLAEGWGSRCSNLVCDARRLPLRDGSAAAVTSVGGFDNIVDNGPAYAEAARVLAPDGLLLDVVRLYEPGPTVAELEAQGQVAASWQQYQEVLARLGFRLEDTAQLNTGRGKTDPADGLPIGDEAWEHKVVVARRAVRR